MYAVVGATGNTGRAVVKELKGAGRKSGLHRAQRRQGEGGARRRHQDRGRRARRPRRPGKGAGRRQARVHRHRPQSEIGRAADQRDRGRQGRGRGIHRQGVGRPRRDRPERRVGQRPGALQDRGASEEERAAMVHPQPRPVHAEHHGAGGQHQERRQDHPAVAEGSAGGADRRARHRRARRARAARAGQAQRQDVRRSAASARRSASSPR